MKLPVQTRYCELTFSLEPGLLSVASSTFGTDAGGIAVNYRGGSPNGPHVEIIPTICRQSNQGLVMSTEKR
jgi:hypothetical protein